MVVTVLAQNAPSRWNIDLNIMANIEGAYHSLEGTYLQRYLNEFCYRFNRRHNWKPLFDHLLACSVLAHYKTAAEFGI